MPASPIKAACVIFDNFWSSWKLYEETSIQNVEADVQAVFNVVNTSYFATRPSQLWKLNKCNQYLLFFSLVILQTVWSEVNVCPPCANDNNIEGRLTCDQKFECDKFSNSICGKNMDINVGMSLSHISGVFPNPWILGTKCMPLARASYWRVLVGHLFRGSPFIPKLVAFYLAQGFPLIMCQ